ncbi:MAG: hypothetical protein LBF42_00375, partial [Puniceicoccales bacterium]|nr:hypothetical protein [Puniceicoccales bacterium]
MEHKNIKASKFREGLLSWLSRHWKKISFRRFRSAAVFCCCSLLLLASTPAAFAGLLDIYKINATDALNTIVSSFTDDTIDKLASNDQVGWGGSVIPNTRAEFGTFTKNAFESLKTDLVDNFFNALQGVNEKLGENGVDNSQFETWKTDAERTLNTIVSSFTDDTIDKLASNDQVGWGGVIPNTNTRAEFGTFTKNAFESLKTDLVDNFFNALQDVNEKLGENGVEDDQLNEWKTNAKTAVNSIVNSFGNAGDTNTNDPIDKLGAADSDSYQRKEFGVATRDAFGGLRGALVDNFFGAVDDVDNAITASLMKRVGVLEENFDTLMGPGGLSNDCCYGIIPEMKRDIDAMACKCDDRFNEMNDILTEVYDDVATLKSEFAGLQPIVLGPAGET